jgi:hypothetical protein
MVWMSEKLEDVTIESVITGVESQYYRLKGFFNNIVNT